MIIGYIDELGGVIEEVDEYGISFDGDKAYFNDKIIETKYIRQIQKDKIIFGE